MGRAREAVAVYFMYRESNLRFAELNHQKYTAAMSAGVVYTDSQDLVNESTEKFRDILYNIEGDYVRKVESPEDVRSLWEEVMGKPWPSPDNRSDDKEAPDEDS